MEKILSGSCADKACCDDCEHSTKHIKNCKKKSSICVFIRAAVSTVNGL